MIFGGFKSSIFFDEYLFNVVKVGEKILETLTQVHQ